MNTVKSSFEDGSRSEEALEAFGRAQDLDVGQVGRRFFHKTELGTPQIEGVDARHRILEKQAQIRPHR